MPGSSVYPYRHSVGLVPPRERGTPVGRDEREVPDRGDAPYGMMPTSRASSSLRDGEGLTPNPRGCSTPRFVQETRA